MTWIKDKRFLIVNYIVINKRNVGYWYLSRWWMPPGIHCFENEESSQIYHIQSYWRQDLGHYWEDWCKRWDLWQLQGEYAKGWLQVSLLILSSDTDYLYLDMPSLSWNTRYKTALAELTQKSYLFYTLQTSVTQRRSSFTLPARMISRRKSNPSTRRCKSMTGLTWM